MRPIRVFVSRPSRFLPEHQPGVERFLQVLAAQGLQPLTVGTLALTANDNPTQQVVRLVDNTYGMVVLGWPQVQIEQGRLRGEPMAPTSLPTEWNHIEAAVAVARGRPLMFLRERSVAERGMLDARSLGWFVHDVNGADPAWPESMVPALKRWLVEVQRCRHRTISLDGLRVLRLFRPPQPLTQREIDRQLGDVESVRLRRVLNKLEETGLLTTAEGSRPLHYAITPHGSSFLAGFLTGAPLNHIKE